MPAFTSNVYVLAIIKMKSCLASLEALESELVPNLNAIFNSTTDHSKHFAFLLINHWKQQAETLKDLVFAIIDPFTLCQVRLISLNKLTYYLFIFLHN